MFATEHNRRRILTALGFGLGIVAILGSISLLDRPLVSLVRGISGKAILDLAMFLGIFGVSAPYFFASIFAFLYLKFQQRSLVAANRALFVLLGCTVAPFLTDILKLFFGRSRPYLLLEQGIYAFRFLAADPDFSSFPSEHATIAAAMAATFSMLFRTYRPTFFLVALLVACSRIVLGVHYPSDAIAGMLVGLATISIIEAAFRHYKLPLHQHPALS